MKTGHIGVNVTELERSIAFYREVFGFTVMLESEEEGRRFAFLGDGEKLILTLWQQSDGTFATDLPGLHHLSFEVDSVEEVKRFEDKLRSMNVPLIYDGVVSHGEGFDSGGIFFCDPDEIRLEIFCSSGVAEQVDVPTDGTACGFF